MIRKILLSALAALLLAALPRLTGFPVGSCLLLRRLFLFLLLFVRAVLPVLLGFFCLFLLRRLLPCFFCRTR